MYEDQLLTPTLNYRPITQQRMNKIVQKQPSLLKFNVILIKPGEICVSE